MIERYRPASPRLRAGQKTDSMVTNAGTAGLLCTGLQTNISTEPAVYIKFSSIWNSK